eukprot:CAMPEP_0113545094 /NCGR_PEP_ID=MMETSP0015_2-20120614/11072_1 /TAXON_ID=2838 /ORGANISM="Odontella" /LENGTH=771 /DNA_ID=CAMNT_0000445425 /DNA_START=15 /DNA_END=2330 /DNA_ORIENTATION=- /assembly_acc=CAM_ASM_000160
MAPMTVSKGALAALLLSSALDGSNAFQPSSPQAGGRFGVSAPKPLGRRVPSPSVVPTSSSPVPAQATSTSLGGKLWDKLGIESDDPGEYHWYVINCIATMELQLLQQVKRAAAEMPPRDRKYIKKLTVPTQRSLRSHGPKNVVDVKALYPGYVFCQIRLCPETYEPLQRCPLTRSWMGTVHMKGMRKLPVIPVSLNDDEVEKFQLLDEETDAMHAKYGKDYDGSGDSGKDLLDQYAGYEVDGMVKVLGGKHGGEDGVVKRLKDGKIKVRLFTYGTSFDEWYEPKEIRPMTDAEVLKGFTGPEGPVSQTDYEESIGRKPKDFGRRGAVDEGGPGGRRGSLRNQLTGSMSGGQGDRRNTRRDRQARGERGAQRDNFGRTREEAEREDKQWKQYKEQQKAEESTQGSWGLKGDKPWMYEDTQDISGQDDAADARQEDDRRRMRRRDGGGDERFGGDRDWQSAGPSTGRKVDRSRDDGGWDTSGGAKDSSSGGDDDDFFAALMDDLSDTLDSASSNDRAPSSRGGGSAKPSRSNVASQTQQREEDDFFASLMSDLGDDEPAPASAGKASSRAQSSGGGGGDDDDFFAALEADLSDTLDAPASSSSAASSGGAAAADDDFFASLESDLSGALDAPLPSPSPSSSPKKAAAPAAADDDFFASLEEEMSRDLDSPPPSSSSGRSGGGGAAAEEDDFFAALESDLSSELDSSPASVPAPAVKRAAPAPAAAAAAASGGGGGGGENLSKLTVPALKDMLRERGLKVGGKKAELIERLQTH